MPGDMEHIQKYDITMLEVSDQIAVLNKIFKRNAFKFIHNVIAVFLQSRYIQRNVEKS